MLYSENDLNDSQENLELPDDHIESESDHDRLQIAIARLEGMQDGESEIGKLNYIINMDMSLKMV
jgi:hypothetical protein